MTTLITGASGFTGGWLVRTLAADSPDETLRVLARPTSNLSALDGLAFERVNGDLLNPDSLRVALEDVSRVYHCAGWISLKRRDGPQAYRINGPGTLNLFDAALAAGVERVVYSASIFAHGPAPPDQPTANEDTLFTTDDLLTMPYIRAKREVELAAADYLARGLPLVRLYPGVCFGPGDRNRSSTGVLDMWLRGHLPASMTGGGVCVTDVRDIAQAFIAAMRQGQVGRKYFAGGYNLTIPELFAQAAPLAGRRPPLLRIPAKLARPAMALAETVSLLPALDEGQVRLMAHRWWYDSSRAQTELGVSFRPLEETLRDTIGWLRANSL